MSNSEGDYPQSAMIAESLSSAPTDNCNNLENVSESEDLDLNFSDEDDGSSEIESSGISSGGWSETSGCSSAGSNSDNLDGFRELEKQLRDSAGDGVDLISSDAMEQDEEEDHHNSSSALSLTQLTSREVYASPKTTPAGIVSFGNNFDSDNVMSPIMMGGSEDAADIRPYDSRYEGSLSDLMGIVESSNNQFYDNSDDSEEDNSAPMAGNYLIPPTKRSEQARGPNPMLKPTVFERPPTPPSPQKRFVKGPNGALPVISPEPRKKTFAKVPVGVDSPIKSKKSAQNEKSKKKKSGKHDGKKRNETNEKVSIVSERLTSEDFGFKTTICSFCSRNVGADIRKCMSCKEAYFCAACTEIGAVGEHQQECAIWKSKGKPSDSKPVVIPNAFTPADPSEASKKNKKKCESGKYSMRTNGPPVKEPASHTSKQGPSDDDLGSSPDIIMCESIDVTRAKVQEDDEEEDHFSFDSIPEFSIHNEDSNSQGDQPDPTPIETNQSEKPQRNTVKRAQRSLAYLFDSPAPVSQSNSNEDKPDAIVEEATSDDESFYSNAEEKTMKADAEDFSKTAFADNLPDHIEEDVCSDSIFRSESLERNSKANKMTSVYNEDPSKMIVDEKLSKSSVSADDSSDSDSAVSSEMSIDSLIGIEDDEDEAQTRRGAPSILPLSNTPSPPAFGSRDDVEDSTGVPDEFHDEPLQQNSDLKQQFPDPLLLPHAEQNDKSPEVFHDEPLQNSREILYGDEQDQKRKQRRADVAEKARRERRREHRLIALTVVALICTLMALSAVAGGVIALTFFAEEDGPDSPSYAAQTAAPKPATLPAPVSPSAADAGDGSNIFTPGNVTTFSFTQSPTTPVPETEAPTTAPPTLPPMTIPPTVAPTNPPVSLPAAPTLNATENEFGGSGAATIELPP